MLMIIGFLLILGAAGSWDLSVAQGIRWLVPWYLIIIGVTLIAIGAVNDHRRSDRKSDRDR